MNDATSAGPTTSGSRFPNDSDDEGIAAEYTNGIFEVRLPVTTGSTSHAKEIDSQA
jgi:HSP20 family protein